MAALYNLFIHADQKTPYWLGYIIARPKMHRIHHQSGYHRQNYGLPIWDLLFRSWENPKSKIEHCGFSPEKERMVLQMLMTKNVDH